MTKDEELIWHQEANKLELTEAICKFMQTNNISREELATRLGCHRTDIDRFLDGRKWMTVNYISRVCMALNCSLKIHCVPCEPIPDWI